MIRNPFTAPRLPDPSSLMAVVILVLAIVVGAAEGLPV